MEWTCDFCGEKVEEVRQCETCGKMACQECLESEIWSENGYQCKECQIEKASEYGN